MLARGLPANSETWDTVEARGEDADAAYWKSDIFLGQNEPEIERAVRAMLRHNQVALAVEHLAYCNCEFPAKSLLRCYNEFPYI